MKKWICLCLIMLLCAAACAMLAEGEALPASDEPPVEKNLTHGRFEAVGPIEEKTVALPDGSYCYCRLDCGKPFAEFLPYAQAEVARVKAAPDIDDGEDGESLFFISTLPWLRFTGLSLPTPSPADSNPRITFGKCVEQDGKACLPVNLTVHHALADGLHVARFFEAFEQRTREF